MKNGLPVYYNHPNWDAEKDHNLIHTSKLMWLATAEQTTTKQFPAKLKGIALFWKFMAKNNANKVTKNNIDLLIAFILTHFWYKGHAIRRPSLITFGNFTLQAPIQTWRISLSNLGIAYIDHTITNTTVHRTLKKLIPDLTSEELSYSDWSVGGNLNYLTLDYGCYYVEHCVSFFEQHIALATALNATIKGSPIIGQKSGLTPIPAQQIVSRILHGDDIKTIYDVFGLKNSTIDLAYSHTKALFESVYSEVSFYVTLLQEKTVHRMLSRFGLKLSQANIDRIREITFDWLREENVAKTASLLKDCTPPVSLGLFKSFLKDHKGQCDQHKSSIPTEKEYIDIGVSFPSSQPTRARGYPGKLIRLVEKAGITTVVALTGWRKSEFGFPLTSITSIVNTDKLDGYALPLRYRLSWYVPKTHGRIKQDREITSYIAMIATCLHKMNMADENSPCLYSTFSTNNNIFNSGENIKRSVVALWGHYARHYKNFKILNDQEIWHSIADAERNNRTLTKEESVEKTRLLSTYPKNYFIKLSLKPNLVDAWQRCKDELPRVEIYLTTGRKKEDWLVSAI